MAEPKGVRFNKTQTEYQLFPEEYFSAADCSIYFNDVWMDDISGLNFQLSEAVQPVFGYGSRTWDYVMRGRRTIQGSFQIAFRESGYLFAVLDHIGQINAGRPAMSYVMEGKETPKWYGGVKSRIEEILSSWHQDKAAKPEERRIPRWESSRLIPGMQNEEVKTLQAMLRQHGLYDGNIDGVYGEDTTNAVSRYQQSKGYTMTGVADERIRSDFAYVERVVKPDQSFGSQTPNGAAEPRMVQYEKEIWGNRTVEGGEMARKLDTYFYRGRTTDVNGLHTAPLYQKGIDVYINYGPLPEYLKQRINTATSEVSFNTTVRALRNVQITAMGQTIDANTGEPIAEVYGFIAQDLD